MGAVSRTVRLPGRGRRRGKGGRDIVRLCSVCGDRLLGRGKGDRGSELAFFFSFFLGREGRGGEMNV